jgi:hypothetical protein
MKSRKIQIASLAAVVIFLTACGNGPIDVVKDSYLPIDDTLSLGKAFSNRNLCDDIEWKEIEDDRGRVIVEYSCEIDVGDYFESLKEKNIESAKVNLSTTVGADKKQRDFIKSTINNYNKLLSSLNSMSEEEKNIWNLSKNLSNSWAVVELPKGESKRTINTKFEQIKEKYTLGSCTNYTYLPTGEVVQACRKYIQSSMENKQKSLGYTNSDITRREEETAKKIEEYENESTIQLFEYAQWSFKEVEGELYPKLISLGYNRVMKNGEIKSIKHYYAKRALKNIYENKIESVEEFAVSSHINL